MKKIAFILALCSFQTAEAFSVLTPVEQGNLVYARTETGENIFFDGDKLHSSPDGYVVFGLSYNAPKEIEIIVEKNGQKTSRFLTVSQKKWKTDEIRHLPKNKVHYSEKTADLIKKDNLKLKAERKKSSFNQFPVCFTAPLTGRISGGFADMRTLNGEVKSFHSGVDIAAPEGTPIKSPMGGKVVVVFQNSFLTGGTVLIRHGYYLSSSYSHLSEISVKEGDIVRQGDIIGHVGKTGRATGPHLHLAFFYKETRLNPLEAFKNSCPSVFQK